MSNKLKNLKKISINIHRLYLYTLYQTVENKRASIKPCHFAILPLDSEIMLA